MKYIRPFLLIITGVVLYSCTNRVKVHEMSKSPVDYVNPITGTDYFGHTFPGAVVPWSLVQLSPDNGEKGWTYSSGYSYPDNTIMGFSHTHFSGTGGTPGGDIMIMPTTGQEIKIHPGPKDDPDKGYRSRFDHREEWASPGYYSVFLKDYNILVELTATRRAGMHRYFFPKSEKSTIIIDLGHQIGRNRVPGKSDIRITDNTHVEGAKYNDGLMIYFAAEFSKPFHSYGTFDADYGTPESGSGIFPYKNEEKGEHVGAFLSYHTTEQEMIMVKVGISYVSVDGAKKNLKAEIQDWDFEKIHQQARSSWEQALNAIRIKNTSEDLKTIFYTAMYHSLLAQYISQDVDGRYMGMDGKIHRVNGYNFHPSFSCWDTYRTEQPLLTIIAPGHINDMIRSIVDKTRNFGWLPAQHFRNVFRPSMVGDHLIPIITDAYVKGYRDFDADFIYGAMRQKALEIPKSPTSGLLARSGLEYYLTMGYTPCDRVTESVSNTLELAYDDWCIAQLAKALGKVEDYKMFMERAGYYHNLYDSSTQFMRPKMFDGTWLPPVDGHEQEIARYGEHTYYKYFDPLLVGRRPNRHYTESNAWQYIWSVQHDVRGLIDLMGGNDPFTARLDTFYNMSPVITPPKYVGVVGTIGQHVQGNQPSHHVPYLYDYAGKPWKTQETIRKVLALYRTGPGGICGNEDMGSLSSWFIFSAMGFYPVTPGSTVYAIGSPVIGEVTLHLQNDKTFRIIAENTSDKNKYIQSATLNGQPFNRSWIDHSEIMAGGTLHFVMGPEPNKKWASGKQDAPYSVNK